jgi:DNA-directed RNA polymerase subunit beta
MNVGQVMETHLGWASYALGKQVGEMLDRFYDLDNIKARLIRFFKDPALEAEIKDMSLEELQEIWKKEYKDGVHVATPVFDGATEEEVRACLAEAGLPWGAAASCLTAAAASASTAR